MQVLAAMIWLILITVEGWEEGSALVLQEVNMVNGILRTVESSIASEGQNVQHSACISLLEIGTSSGPGCLPP